jgi:hypothetical protein
VEEVRQALAQTFLPPSQAFDHHGHSNSRPPSTIEMSDLMAFTVPNGNTGLASMREMNYINQTISILFFVLVWSCLDPLA